MLPCMMLHSLSRYAYPGLPQGHLPLTGPVLKEHPQPRRASKAAECNNPHRRPPQYLVPADSSH